MGGDASRMNMALLHLFEDMQSLLHEAVVLEGGGCGERRNRGMHASVSIFVGA